MPRYFFDVNDDQGYHDLQVTELPDLEAARSQALRTFGETLKKRATSNSKEWLIDITDDARQSMLKLTFSLSETRGEAA